MESGHSCVMSHLRGLEVGRRLVSVLTRPLVWRQTEQLLDPLQVLGGGLLPRAGVQVSDQLVGQLHPRLPVGVRGAEASHCSSG